MSGEDPVCKFGRWSKWEHRKLLMSDERQGGVYLFAHFVGDPPTSVPTSDEFPYEVIYVGDAKDLTRRPLSGVHHKIRRYRNLFGAHELERLYVSIAPLYETGCKDYAIQRTASAYMEAKLIWKFACRYGHPPVMSAKEDGEGTGYLDEAIVRLKSGVAV